MILTFYLICLEQSITKAVVHGLDLGVVIQGVRAELTAETGLLEATEGSLVRDHVVAVDPDGTGLESVGHADGSVDVLGVNSGSET
jgi:hypothetical protein